MEGSIGIAALYGHRDRLAEGIASGKWQVASGKWKVTVATEMNGKRRNCFAWYAWEMSPFGDDCYDKQSARGLALYGPTRFARTFRLIDDDCTLISGFHYWAVALPLRDVHLPT